MTFISSSGYFDDKIVDCYFDFDINANVRKANEFLISVNYYDLHFRDIYFILLLLKHTHIARVRWKNKHFVFEIHV